MDVLHGFLAELDERESHIHNVAQEWGVDLEADSAKQGGSTTLAATAVHFR
jgi:hypothetical protein